jgi:hypothetical protein
MKNQLATFAAGAATMIAGTIISQSFLIGVAVTLIAVAGFAFFKSKDISPKRGLKKLWVSISSVPNNFRKKDQLEVVTS